MRRFLTHDTSHIGLLRQVRWHYGTYLPRWRAGKMTLYRVMVEGELAGYGLLQKGCCDWWVTGALLEEFRGAGYGERLFRFLTEEAVQRGGRALLDVRQDNVAALSLYKKLGYSGIKEGDELVVMVLDPKFDPQWRMRT